MHVEILAVEHPYFEYMCRLRHGRKVLKEVCTISRPVAERVAINLLADVNEEAVNSLVVSAGQIPGLT